MMDRKITESEIQYLMDHLAFLYSGSDLPQFLATEETGSGEFASGDSGSVRPTLFFPLSPKPLAENEIIAIHGIPVLFPCSGSGQWYSVEENRVRFHHDILKSAFYLLSGYQEFFDTQRDLKGRYPWKNAIQYRLGITQIPVVNHYFEVILEAFGTFCRLNGLEFQRRGFESPVLFLSHDVDRIRKYSIRNLVYSGMQLFGLKPSVKNFAGRLKNLWVYKKGTLLFRKDPYWNFEELMELERGMQISSTWYLLEKTRMDNSRYHFESPRIRSLIGRLSRQGHEIGIHGTLESSDDPAAMAKGIQRLNAVCDTPVSGIRQHFLKYSIPATGRIQADSALAYDATLGFAEQIGFRNNYAYPFRLYDFDRHAPMDIWQIPLNVMDVTLLGYMKIPVPEIIGSVRPLLREVSRFKGVFSLLWHNCSLDEEEYPGINAVYRSLLEEIMGSGYRSLTGDQVIKSLG
jgi:hypothetical protein